MRFQSAKHHCDALGVEEGHDYHQRARELIAHEAARIDHAYDWTLSESIDWHETEIGHAAHVHAGHRELFAYCMMDVEFNDGRNRCPIENLAAVYKFMASFGKSLTTAHLEKFQHLTATATTE